MYRMTESPDQPTDAGAEDRVPLPGSERAASGVRRAASVPADETIQITVVLRRRAEVPEAALSRATPLSRNELAQAYGADPADVDLATRILTSAGAQIVGVDPASRRLRVAGSVGVLCTIFGTSLVVATEQEPDGTVVTYRERTGNLSLPAALDGVVIAVLGLDDRPQTRTRFQIAAPAAVTTSYTPPQLAEIYQFPAGTDGTGQTVAILELGGGFTQAELTSYFRSLGVTPPTVTAVGVDGGANRPEQNPNGADGEVMLDIEIVGAMAPGADIVVYFAPNTDAGFLDALSQAAHADTTPVAISISWGQREDAWTAQARTAFDQALTDAAALGATVTAAAGDDGSSDGATDGRVHTDFPASSPHALACGGTRLDANPTTGVVNSEVVWNNGVGSGATGGGGERRFRPAVLAVDGRRAHLGGPAGPGRPRRRRERRSADRISGAGRRSETGVRRNQCGVPALGRPARPDGTVAGPPVRLAAARDLCRRRFWRGGRRVPGHHLGQQRCLSSGAGVGRLHRAGCPDRRRVARCVDVGLDDNCDDQRRSAPISAGDAVRAQSGGRGRGETPDGDRVHREAAPLSP